MKELLKQLCELDGVPGYEDEVREFIEKQAAPYADEMLVDAVGNLIVFKKGAKPRKRPLLVMAHMDEVGFLVRDITEDGMLKLAKAGGIDPRVLIGRRMRVGEQKLPGIISLKAIHLTTPEERKEAPGLDSLYIDIGCTSREEAEALVMRGEPAVFDSRFMEFGVDCVKAKAIDDRIGCAVMVALLELIDNPRQDVALIAVLRSPLFGFSPSRLAEIRSRDRQGDYLDAVRADGGAAGRSPCMPQPVWKGRHR